MTSLDLKAALDELRTCAVGMRLQNIYDITPKVFLLKFAAGERKVLLLVEVGIRLHLTTYARDKPKIPSQFTLKLRKHVRSWRLDAVDQIGVDRVVDMKFGSGETSYHFIIEMYGKGNFILTDQHYIIMMLLRTHKDEDVKVAVKETYLMQPSVMVKVPAGVVLQKLNDSAETDTLRTVLSALTPNHSPGVIDHVILSCELQPNAKKATWPTPLPTLAAKIAEKLAMCDRWLEQPLAPGGFLIQRLAESGKPPQMFDFSPVLLKQFEAEGNLISPLSSFSEAVERYFLPLEQEKVAQHNTAKVEVVVDKKEKFMHDHQMRIDRLLSEEEANRRKGELIELNAKEVDEAIQLISQALATGMSWDVLKSVVRARQREGLPVANMIHELFLERSSMALLISREVEEGDEFEDCDVAPEVIEVDLNLSAHANAAKYYEKKKANAVKLQKTVEATDKAAVSAERKGERVAQRKGPAKRDITALRTQFWFEKFFWFLTTHRFLVVCARDNLQSDLLVRRYMKPGDIFIHCDVPGAPPCLVKNPSCSRIPLLCLQEAGAMTVCRSTSWAAKAPVSAWWVYPTQINRTPSGTSNNAPANLTIRGKKNYLAAMPLILGVGVLFRMPRALDPSEIGSTRLQSTEEIESIAPLEAGTPDNLARQPSVDMDAPSGSRVSPLTQPSSNSIAFPSRPQRSQKDRILNRHTGTTPSTAHQPLRRIQQSFRRLA